MRKAGVGRRASDNNCGRGTSGVGRGLRDVLARASKTVDIVVEAETDAQLEEALAAGVKHILADNRSPATVAAWVRRAGPQVTIQASGGITVANAAEYARAGARLISVGVLTHSAPAVPIRFELLSASPATSAKSTITGLP